MVDVEVDLTLGRRDLRRVGAVGGGSVCRRLGLERLLRLFGQAFRADTLRLRRSEVGTDLECGLVLSLDRLGVLGVVQRELLVCGQTAVAGTGQRLVRTALAVREYGRAATREFFAFA